MIWENDYEYIEAVEFTLLQEGVISNDPKDTGGATLYGVSSRWYPREFTVIKNLLGMGEVEDAVSYVKNFYYNEFWLAAHCDTMQRSLALCMFDTAVNCGVGRANRIRDLSNHDWKDYLLERCDWNTRCKTEATHLRGWTKRIIRLKNYIEEI